jgi:hypothetical protein
VRRFGFLVVLAALAPGDAPAQRQGQPYAIHDLRLGTPLKQFRSLERWEDGDDNRRLACSNEGTPAGDLVRPSGDMQAAGAIRCAVVRPRPNEPGEWTLVRLNFFGQEADAGFVFYRRPEDPDHRLTQVELALDNQYFATVLSLFRRTYGQPTAFDLNSVSTLFGAQLSNATYMWNNPHSSIRMDMFSVSIDRMSVMFAHTELWDDLGAKLREVRLRER